MTPWKFKEDAIRFRFDQYVWSGGTAVEAWSAGESVCIISVNPPGAPRLPENQFYLKTWSENEEIPLAMIGEGIIQEVNPPVTAQSGFATVHAYQFTEQGKMYCDTQSNQ